MADGCSRVGSEWYGRCVGQPLNGEYRYHARWREARDETKYAKLLVFGAALPTIRERAEEDLRRSGLPREKVLAAVVRLLELTRLRVGNEEYGRVNDSYGLTTLRDEHVDIAGSRLRFQFRGKSGKEHEVDVRDRRLARIVKRCQDIPGQVLFQYRDERGEYQAVESADVNAYLRELSGHNFTAKDFRTWAGTVLAAQELRTLGRFESATQAKRNVVEAIKSMAKQLGNTPTICRKCYVHPVVLDAYLDGQTLWAAADRGAGERPSSAYDLHPEEQLVMELLRECAASEPRLAG